MRDRVYFISDIHLGAPGRPRWAASQQRELIGFLRWIQPRAEALYIVGDLFDFWFEHRWVVPRAGARVLFQLHALVQDGVPVTCLPGNHDIWLGSYLSEEVGLHLPGGPITVTHQGKRLFLAHGDEFRGDLTFKLSRALLKNPLSIAAFSTVHPTLAHLAARATSTLSGLLDLAGLATGEDDEVFLRGAEKELRRGADAVICGHYHRRIHRPLAGGELLVLGDWLRHFTYGELHRGVLALRSWQRRETP